MLNWRCVKLPPGFKGLISTRRKLQTVKLAITHSLHCSVFRLRYTVLPETRLAEFQRYVLLYRHRRVPLRPGSGGNSFFRKFNKHLLVQRVSQSLTRKTSKFYCNTNLKVSNSVTLTKVKRRYSACGLSRNDIRGILRRTTWRTTARQSRINTHDSALGTALNHNTQQGEKPLTGGVRKLVI
jgi:hypothetical protein